MNRKKIATIIGARPQFIKTAALSPVLRSKFQEILIHTGQHYDHEMSMSFFSELAIPEPDYNLQVGSSTALKQIAAIIMRLDDIFTAEKPDLVVVYGDTNSTAAGALAAAKHQIPLAHVEAGLREFNKSIPEESNKLVTDILTDIYLCPTQTGVDILKSMGITKEVHNVGDVMIDLNYRFHDQIVNNLALLNRFNISSGNYYFLTCHRASNTDDPLKLRNILEAVNNLDLPVVFPIHPRTEKVIEVAELSHLVGDNPAILKVKPLPYLETQTLICHAKAVLTDSGGVTKEAYYYKVPGIILDRQTEWVETVREGWNHIVGPEKEAILSKIENLKIPTCHSNCLGDGNASIKIKEIFDKYLN